MKIKLTKLYFAALFLPAALAALTVVAQNETPNNAELAEEVQSAITADISASVLPAESVTPTLLKPIFEKDRWKAEEVNGGLKLKDPRSPRVIAVEWSPEKELISFVMWYKFDDFVFKRQKVDLANRINSEVMLTRASVDEEGDLRFDYWMSYSSGVSGDQLLSALRNFERTTEAALRIKDKRDIVK